MDIVSVLQVLKGKESFQAIADQVPLHVVVTDENGVIIYANKAVEKTTGYSKEEIISNTPALWGKQMPKEFYEKMWDTIKVKKQTFTGVVKNKRKNGQVYEAAAKIIPLLVESGLKKEEQLVGFVGIEKDLTEIKAIKERYNISDEDVLRLYDALFM